jgi:hypothetical protein
MLVALMYAYGAGLKSLWLIYDCINRDSLGENMLYIMHSAHGVMDRSPSSLPTCHSWWCRCSHLQHPIFKCPKSSVLGDYFIPATFRSFDFFRGAGDITRRRAANESETSLGEKEKRVRVTQIIPNNLHRWFRAKTFVFDEGEVIKCIV